MKNSGKLIAVICCLVGIITGIVVKVSLAKADKTAALSVVPSKLPTHMDALTAARLDAALAKVKAANNQIAAIQRELQPVVKVATDIQDKYKMQLFTEQGQPIDTVNFETGEIVRRAPPVAIPPDASRNKAAQLAPPASPAAEPTKTAKK